MRRASGLGAAGAAPDPQGLLSAPGTVPALPLPLFLLLEHGSKSKQIS